MAIQGGLNPVVTQLITDNLTGKVDLSRLTVTATPYPVNSGGTYSITIHYDYPFGSFTLTGSTSHYSILTLPINSRAVGMSEAVIR
ncbi:MAG: hypothetical protein JWM44_2117 [Bacilli bacterium]|nr:hypothetical protein [Bacilli bacterium]